jgi:hypothetical protein
VGRTDLQLPSDILHWLIMNAVDGTEKIERSDDHLMKAVVERKSEAPECIYFKYESLLGAVILRVIRNESEVDAILMMLCFGYGNWEIATIPTDEACAGSLLLRHAGAHSTLGGQE